MDKKIIQYYFDKAKESKEEIRPTLNDVLEFTDTTYKITDERKGQIQFREIEPVISSSITSLVNFVMSQVFARGASWASLEVNETMYKGQAGAQSDIVSEAQIRDINESLEKNTSIVFDYINTSNYYTEIAKAVRDAIVLGTGAYVIREQPSTVKPFSYEYHSLDNLYFWEDAYGKPDYIFNQVFDITLTELEDRYGAEALSIPAELTDKPIDGTIDIIECVIPEYDEKTARTVYNYIITLPDFETIIFEKVMNYNPYVIFRWNLESGLQHGIGLGIIGLKTFRELEDYKARRAKQADKILNPPLKAMGRLIAHPC